MKRRFLVFLTFIAAALAAYDFPASCQENEFDNIFDSADDEFKKMKKTADNEFSRMRRQVDEQFGGLLENAWREFELARGIVRDTTPKPEKPPVAEQIPPTTPPSEKIPDKQSSDRKPVEKPTPATPMAVPETTPDTSPTPRPSPSPAPAPKSAKNKEFKTFDFYGREITLDFDAKWTRYKTGNTITPQVISRYWNAFCATDYAPFITKAHYITRELHLNDWGYCRLINAFSSAIIPNAGNERPLFVWFILVKSGYDARIGYTNDKVFVLLPSDQTVYQAAFYEFGGVKYYITSLGRSTESVTKLYTYDGKNPEAKKRIDFSFISSPAVGKNSTDRTLSFEYGGKHEITVAVNRTMIDFLSTYPQTSLDVYFRASISSDTESSLSEGLKPLLRGKSEAEQVGLLLRFVQTAFAYETDDEQFGEENYLFTEESLFYPYCDCEDRSFLFSHLVKSLVGIDVIGLQYPGHIATAVKFSSAIPGDTVTVNGNRYVICDPTYIGADIGRAMPQFKNTVPGVIRY